MIKHKKLTRRITAAAASAVMALTSLGGASIANADTADLDLDNYARLLQYSLYFFDANYCGAGTGDISHFSWRDDCHTGDAVPGGFHDAGDNIICGLTEGFSASTLGWMYYEYKDEFDSTGTTAHLRDITNWFADFFIASTTLDGSSAVSSFVYEIGDDGSDHGKWRSPELMWDRGAGETYSTTNGGSDVAAQYAAALAQNYINFGREKDLEYAKALYDFAAKYRKITFDQMTYSDKSAEDDIAWAAGWLYLATHEPSYLEANSKDTSGTNDWINDYYYGGVWLGAALINAEITGNWTAPVNYIKSKATGSDFYYADSWGSARYNTLMQMCAMVATKHKDESGADLSEWSKKQMNMVLGDNNANVCLVVGYNSVSATSPHHRAASNLNDDDSWSKWNSWDGNYASVSGSHTLYGALCGGPTSHTDFTTFRKYDAKDATSNEVALDYQVGLVGAAAGLYSYFGTGSVVAEIGDEVTVYPEEIAAANGETPTTGTTTTVDPNLPTTTTTTKATTTTTTVVTSIRTETVSIDTGKAELQVKANGADAIEMVVSATPGVNFNGAIDYTDTSGQYKQFGNFDGAMESSGKFTKTVSLIGVSAQNDTLTLHVWWSEDSSAAFESVNLIYYDVVENPTTTTTTEKAATTSTTDETTTTTKPVTTTTSETPSKIVYGDANCDGEVKLNDAVLIMQALANPNKFGITGTDELHISEDGWANADCNNPGDGVTGKDALAIQKLTLKLIDSLPEE